MHNPKQFDARHSGIAPLHLQLGGCAALGRLLNNPSPLHNTCASARPAAGPPGRQPARKLPRPALFFRPSAPRSLLDLCDE